MTHATSNDLQQHWEKFAEDDPMWYIATWNPNWTVEDFFASGKEMVERILAWAGPDCGRDRALEIGCGLGRTAVHWAQHFQRVDAVDISARMIENAKKLNPPENLHFSTINGKDLSGFPDGVFDLVFSFIVFQHIPHEDVLAAYLKEISRVLKPGALAALQYDCRPEGLLMKAYKALPDFMLIRNHRRYIRRYRRRPERLRQLMSAAGLTIRDEQGQGTEEHFFLLAR